MYNSSSDSETVRNAVIFINVVYNSIFTLVSIVSCQLAQFLSQLSDFAYWLQCKKNYKEITTISIVSRCHMNNFLNRSIWICNKYKKITIVVCLHKYNTLFCAFIGIVGLVPLCARSAKTNQILDIVLIVLQLLLLVVVVAVATAERTHSGHTHM